MLRINSQSVIITIFILLSAGVAGCFFTGHCQAEPIAKQSSVVASSMLSATVVQSDLESYPDLWSVSLKKGISLALKSNNATDQSNLFAPALTWSTENRRHSRSAFRADKHRSDRYKNTIPVIYRVTLKGYSIMEFSDKKAESWSLDKVKDEAFRKPAIMISFSKSF